MGAGEGGLDRRAALAAFWRRWWPDLAALAFLVLLAFCYLSPALKDGPTFGPADLGRGNSLLTNLAHPVALHNGINGDINDQGVPWNTVDWRLVHHGELPLWNSLSGNGMPQLLNFESAPLALPSLVGYLFPLSLAFLVTVGVKLLVAGTGIYVLCRLLGARPLAAGFGGATAMLSGAFSSWLGWSISGPLAWVGWILAACVLCSRAGRRLGAVSLLAVSVAFAIYGGFPEDYVFLAYALGVLLGVAGLVRLATRRERPLRGLGPIVVGVLAGLGLSAPLWLPGIAVLRQSARAGSSVAVGLPLHMAALLVAQGYDGLPVHGSVFFGSWNYYETAAYVGVAAIALAVVALVRSWRRPVVVATACSGLAVLLLVYRLGSGRPVQRLVVSLGLGAVDLQRSLALVGFALAVLAALGLEAVVASWRARSTRVGLWLGSGLVVVALALLWSKVGHAGFAPGAAPANPPSPSVLEALRRASLWWPSATAALLVATAAVASLAARHRGAGRDRLGPAIGASLLGAQSAFLVFAGVGIHSYAPASFPTTPATARLARIVGTSLVGLDDGAGTCAPPTLVPPACGVRAWRRVGFYPETNLGYGIDELGLHDPTIPQAVFDAWPIAGTGRHLSGTNLFAPDIDTVALARRYGAAYVLVGPNLPVPPGMHVVADLENAGAVLRLAAVPGASRFSFATATGSDRVVAASHPGDARYRLSLDAPATGTLVARITDVPGWKASADGSALPVRRAPGDLIEVQVPAGTAELQLTYAPGRLGLGELAAVVVLAALLLAAAAGRLRRQRRPGRDQQEQPPAHASLVASGSG